MYLYRFLDSDVGDYYWFMFFNAGTDVKVINCQFNFNIWPVDGSLHMLERGAGLWQQKKKSGIGSMDKLQHTYKIPGMLKTRPPQRLKETQKLKQTTRPFCHFVPLASLLCLVSGSLSSFHWKSSKKILFEALSPRVCARLACSVIQPGHSTGYLQNRNTNTSVCSTSVTFHYKIQNHCKKKKYIRT